MDGRHKADDHQVLSLHTESQRLSSGNMDETRVPAAQLP
jgi:hypothetical protein